MRPTLELLARPCGLLKGRGRGKVPLSVAAEDPAVTSAGVDVRLLRFFGLMSAAPSFASNRILQT